MRRRCVSSAVSLLCRDDPLSPRAQAGEEDAGEEDEEDYDEEGEEGEGKVEAA